MTTTCFEIQRDGYLKEVKDFDLKQGLPENHDGDLWMDISLQHDSDIKDILTPLSVSERIVTACSEARRSLRFESHRHALYMEYPVHSNWQDKSLSYVSIIILPGALLTLHRHPVPRLGHMIEACTEEPLLQGRDNAFLLTQILVELARENFEALLDIRDQGDHIAQLLDDQPDAVTTDDLIALKRQVDANATAFSEQLYCFSRLSTTESEVFSAKAQGTQFRERLERARYVDNQLARIERRVEMLVNQYNLVLQEKTNHRLQMLTIVSAVFLPLTLIAGI
jgi:magnesium transporter